MTEDKALDKALEALEQYTNVVTSVNDPNSWETVVDGGKPARDAITAIKQARSAPLQEPVEVDAEGENMAVRSFLMLYGQPGLTVGKMKKHMDMSGHSCCPVWVYAEPDGAHLTKAGAQLWIRHLFALEATQPAAQPAPVPLTDGVNVPLTILEAAEASLGSFCSDHGWSDKDMQNMDNLSAYIAQHKAAHGIK